MPTKLKELQDNLQASEIELEICKKRFLHKKKELVETEERLISAREQTNLDTENLRKYKSTNIMFDDIDESRLEDIEKFSKKLPDIFKLIKNEPILEKFACGDIGTTKMIPVALDKGRRKP